MWLTLGPLAERVNTCSGCRPWRLCRTFNASSLSGTALALPDLDKSLCIHATFCAISTELQSKDSISPCLQPVARAKVHMWRIQSRLRLSRKDCACSCVNHLTRLFASRRALSVGALAIQPASTAKESMRLMVDRYMICVSLLKG